MKRQMHELITDVEQVTPDQLTRVLHKKGSLTLDCGTEEFVEYNPLLHCLSPRVELLGRGPKIGPIAIALKDPKTRPSIENW